VALLLRKGRCRQGTGLWSYGAIRDSFVKERRTVTGDGVARLERRQGRSCESIMADAADEKKRQRVIESQAGRGGQRRAVSARVCIMAQRRSVPCMLAGSSRQDKEGPTAATIATMMPDSGSATRLRD
jgi:hypothetical protein